MTPDDKPQIRSASALQYTQEPFVEQRSLSVSRKEWAKIKKHIGWAEPLESWLKNMGWLFLGLAPAFVVSGAVQCFIPARNGIAIFIYFFSGPCFGIVGLLILYLARKDVALRKRSRDFAIELMALVEGRYKNTQESDELDGEEES